MDSTGCSGENMGEEAKNKGRRLRGRLGNAILGDQNCQMKSLFIFYITQVKVFTNYIDSLLINRATYFIAIFSGHIYKNLLFHFDSLDSSMYLYHFYCCSHSLLQESERLFINSAIYITHKYFLN